MHYPEVPLNEAFFFFSLGLPDFSWFLDFNADFSISN